MNDTFKCYKKSVTIIANVHWFKLRLEYENNNSLNNLFTTYYLG